VHGSPGSDAALLAQLQAQLTDPIPTVDVDAVNGRAGGAFAPQVVSTYVTTSLSSPSLPSVLTALTLHMWMRSPVLLRFVQYLLLEFPDAQSADAPLSLYTYTDQTLILNGQLVSQPLTDNSLMDGHWHHFATTWDSATGICKFYVDGLLSMTHSGVQTGQTVPLAGATFSLAKRRWGDALLGWMDDVGFHATMLDAVQIASLAGLPRLGTVASAPLSTSLTSLLATSSPIGFWRFDDLGVSGKPGDVLADSSTNGHDFTVIGVADAAAPFPVRVLVPSRAPTLTTGDRWIVLPSGASARLVYLRLAHGNSSSAVRIDSLSLGSECALYEVDPVTGVQGAAISPPQYITASSMLTDGSFGDFRVMAECTSAPAWATHYFDYSVAPTTWSSVDTGVFPSRVRIAPNHAPLQLPSMTITVDQSRAAADMVTVLQPLARLYPSIEEFQLADADGDDCQVYIVKTSHPFHGTLKQVSANYVNETVPAINISAINYTTPLLLTSESSEVAYVSPLHAAGAKLDFIQYVVVDGLSVSGVITKYLSVTQLPSPPLVSPLSVTVEESHSLLLTLPIDDFVLGVGDAPFITITDLPQKGKLYQVNPDGSRGEQITLQPPFGGTISQWVINVTAISSFYSAEDGSWSDKQVLGPANAWPFYGDNVLAWAAATTDTAEWMEVQFDEQVFVTRVEVFENFNPGHVSRIAMQREEDAASTNWETVWSGTPAAAVPSVAGTRASVFVPNICSLPFPSRRVRLEIASTGPSWAEVDAIRLTGTRALALNVVTDPHYRVIYEADPLAQGADSFAFDANSCEFFLQYRDLGMAHEQVGVTITYHNHAPTASNHTLHYYTDDEGNIANMQFNGIDVDNASDTSGIALILQSLPSMGQLYVAASDRLLSAADLPLSLPLSTSLSYKAVGSRCMQSSSEETASLFRTDSLTFALSDGLATSASSSVLIEQYCVEEYRSPGALVVIVLLLLALGVAVLLCFACVFVVHRHSAVIKASSFLFNILSIVACAGMFLSMLLFVLPVNDSVCLARWWLPCCSITLLLGAIFSKTARIRKIFLADKLTVVRLRDLDVLQWVAGQLSVTLLLLILYSAIDPPRLHYAAAKPFSAGTALDLAAQQTSALSHLSYGACSVSAPFRGLLLAYIGLLVAWGTFLAISVRNVHSQYNEASLLGIVIYNILFCCVIGVPLDFLLDSNPPAQQMLRCFLLYLGTGVIVVGLFGPKIVQLRAGGNRVTKLTGGNQTGTLTSTHGGVNGSSGQHPMTEPAHSPLPKPFTNSQPSSCLSVNSAAICPERLSGGSLATNAAVHPAKPPATGNLLSVTSAAGGNGGNVGGGDGSSRSTNPQRASFPGVGRASGEQPHSRYAFSERNSDEAGGAQAQSAAEEDAVVNVHAPSG